METVEHFELDLLASFYNPVSVRDAVESIEAYEDYMLRTLEPGDFTDAKRSVVFSALKEARSTGCDSQTLVILSKANRCGMTTADWYEYLCALRERAVNPAYMLWLTRTVYRASRLRKVRTDLAEIGETLPEINLAAMGHDGSLLDLPDIKGRAAEMLESIEPPEFRRGFESEVDDVAARSIAESGAPQVRLGIHALDADTVARPGHFIVIGATPRSGKSVLGGQVALNVAQQGGGALFLTAEMSRGEVIERWLCNLANIDLYALNGAGKSDAQKASVADARERLKALPLRVEFAATLKAVESRIVEASRKGCKLVVVDYLQKIRDMKLYRDRSRNEEVGFVAESLKAAATEHGLVVLALSQFSREAAKNEPQMAHLRESGAIEQEADHIILLWRKEDGVYYRIAKNRHGRNTDQWIPLDVDYAMFRVNAGNAGIRESEAIYE